MPRLLAPLASAAVVALIAFPAIAADPLTLSPNLTELLTLGEHGRTYRMMLIIVQIAVLLASAKLLGWLCERIKVPGVIGELLAGVIIGPFLLGSILKLPVHGHWLPLFPKPLSADQWPVNDVIWSFGQFASIILLFVTGLHTDIKQFLRYMGPASLVAVVGLVAPFALGAGIVYIPMFSDLARHDAGQSVLVPALFIGAILAATSIGITARVLSDINKLDTPEGVTILGAAVLDDVLGIIALAIVGGIAAAGSVSTGAVTLIAGKALGFWIGLTLVSLVLAKPLERLIGRIRYGGAVVGLGLAIAFLCSAAAEAFGLAFIIGAYSVGLGLSRTEMAHKLMDELRPIIDFVVPIFFASLGMLVNLGLMFADWRVVVFGLAVTAVAIIGKLLGCGLAAYGTGFTSRGAYRVGLGMMPRGEVALIVAGIGLSRGIIQNNVFGVSIMMTLLTTLLAPILLVPAFAKGGSGRRKRDVAAPKLPSISALPGFVIPVSPDISEPLLNRLLKLAEQHGWESAYDDRDEEVYLLRSRGDAAQIRCTPGLLSIDASDSRQHEFHEFLAQARASMVTDITGATPTASP